MGDGPIATVMCTLAYYVYTNFKGAHMKRKSFALLVILTLAFSLSACGTKTNTIPTEEIQTETSEQKMPEPGETMVSTQATTPETIESAVLDEPTMPETEVQTEAPELEESAQYTFTDMDAIKYEKSSVNVRSLPDKSGDKLGGLNTNDEVNITGQCNETGWFRFEYKGDVAYVSNDYVVDEKVAEQPATSNSDISNSDGAWYVGNLKGLTPTQANSIGEAVANAQSIGCDPNVIYTAEDGHQYYYYISTSNRYGDGGYDAGLIRNGSVTFLGVLGQYYSLHRVDGY